MNAFGTHLIAEFTYCKSDILNKKEELEQILKRGIEKAGFNFKDIYGYQFSPIGLTIIAVIGESHVVIHTYPETNHVSLDIFTCSGSIDQIYALLYHLEKELKPKKVESTELIRGNSIIIKQNNFITEFSPRAFNVKYGIKKKLLSKRSKYQKIDIIENEDFGKMLFLDNDIQIAEKGSNIYNKNLVFPIIKANKKLNKVAILGGGDGGVLHELLKYNPKEVILVDIDEEVIKASKKFLDSICGEAFDLPNVKVVINDANKFLELYGGFDVIIYDLTTEPGSLVKINNEEFLDELFQKIKNSLNKDGMVTLQCCSGFDKKTKELLKQILSKYFKNVKFKKTFIPSFCEEWVFASGEKK